MSDLHDWRKVGTRVKLDQNNEELWRKTVWECSHCHIQAKLRSAIILPPHFRADMHPCDLMVVKRVLQS